MPREGTSSKLKCPYVLSWLLLEIIYGSYWIIAGDDMTFCLLMTNNVIRFLCRNMRTSHNIHIHWLIHWLTFTLFLLLSWFVFLLLFFHLFIVIIYVISNGLPVRFSITIHSAFNQHFDHHQHFNNSMFSEFVSEYYGHFQKCWLVVPKNHKHTSYEEVQSQSNRHSSKSIITEFSIQQNYQMDAH